MPLLPTFIHHLGIRSFYSPKSVLPALVPGTSYERMEVAQRNEAGLAWEKMVHAEPGSDERRRLKDALLAYCKHDTLAIAKLLEVL